MSVYQQLKFIEKVVDCREFIEIMENLITYMKLTGKNVEVGFDNIFDWMAMINTGEYDNYEINEDIIGSGEWEDSDLNYIKKTISELNYFLAVILKQFEKETGIVIYLQHHYDNYNAFFEFDNVSVFDTVLKLIEVKKKAMT